MMAARWAWVPVGLLAAAVTGYAALMVQAVADPGFAVVPAYHDKAIAWDADVAQAARTLRLGWTLTLTATLDTAMHGQVVAMTLAGADGQPLAGVQASLQAFHLAHGRDVANDTGTTDASGRLSVRVNLPHAGLHVYRLRVQRGDDVAAWQERRDVTTAAPRAASAIR